MIWVAVTIAITSLTSRARHHQYQEVILSNAVLAAISASVLLNARDGSLVCWLMRSVPGSLFCGQLLSMAVGSFLKWREEEPTDLSDHKG